MDMTPPKISNFDPSKITGPYALLAAFLLALEVLMGYWLYRAASGGERIVAGLLMVLVFLFFLYVVPRVGAQKSDPSAVGSHGVIAPATEEVAAKQIALPSRDFCLGRWRVQQKFGAESGANELDYFDNGRFEGWGLDVVGNQGQRVEYSGVWEFEKLSDLEFRINWHFDNGPTRAGKFKIVDRNTIHNIDENYDAERAE